MNNPIQITNGGENPTSGKSQVYIQCWHDKQERYLGDMLGVKVPQGEVMAVNQPIFEPALVGFDPKIAGRWVTQTFLVPNDLIILIKAVKQINWRDPGVPAVMIIRMRDRAALRQVEFDTLRLSASSKGTVDVLKGRFDVLSLDEAKALGFVPNPMDAHKYGQESVTRQFSTRILENELQIAQSKEIVKHVSSDGTSVDVAVVHRTRDI